jgi:hypothetical protein
MNQKHIKERLEFARCHEHNNDVFPQQDNDPNTHQKCPQMAEITKV